MAVSGPILQSVGKHLHPVGTLAVANMMLNPSCNLADGSQNLLNYTPTNCTFKQSTAVTPKFGTYCGKYTVTSTIVAPSVQQTFSVQQLQDYTASFYINIPAPISQGISIFGYVYASDNTPVLGPDGVTPLVLGGSVVGSAATSGFIRTSIKMSAPVGAATIVLSIEMSAQPTSLDAFYLDGLQFEPYSNVNPYVDGDMSGYCWSGAQGLSNTLSTGFPSALSAFMVGPLAGAQGGMYGNASMFPGPNVVTLIS
jgi:hypothetical protein